MCGRFSSSTQPSLLGEQFHADPVGVEGHQPSWNVTPASDILVIVASADGARQLRKLRWGLVPKWAKDASGGARMINLRAETVREKKSWRSGLARRRCIIPIDGFYEWQDMGKGNKKQPIYVTAREPEALALAGLWDTWHDPAAGDEQAAAGKEAAGGEQATGGKASAAEQAGPSPDGDLRTCTILTTTPNRLLASVHHRMPVILPPETWDAWLDPGNTDTEALAALLVPARDDLLVCWPVDPAVGNPRNNHPDLRRPLEGHEPRTIDGA
jgi:putative SOS response-associated peptidase YedK